MVRAMAVGECTRGNTKSDQTTSSKGRRLLYLRGADLVEDDKNKCLHKPGQHDVLFLPAQHETSPDGKRNLRDKTRQGRSKKDTPK